MIFARLVQTLVTEALDQCAVCDQVWRDPRVLHLLEQLRRRGEVAAPELRCAEHSTAELRGCRARFEARYINPL